MVIVEADSPHRRARTPQALKALFHIVLNNAQLK